jgi:hypothetical protein
MGACIKKYDAFWQAFEQFKLANPTSATLYKPYAFVYQAPIYHLEKGMGYSVNKYRKLIDKSMTNNQHQDIQLSK